MKILRDYVEQVANGDMPLSAVANVVEIDEGHDPMNEVECTVQKDVAMAGYGTRVATRGDGATRARYYKNHARNPMLDLDAPSQPSL